MTKYHRLKRRYHVGLDFGKRQDHSALAVVEECVWATGEVDRISYAPEMKKLAVLRAVERMGKGMDYLRVLERVRELLVSKALRNEEVVLALDATGVGEPLFELIMEMFWKVKEERGKWLNLAAVVFSNGHKTRWEDYHAFVPKNTLMEGLHLGLERGELRLAEGIAGVEELRRELRNMKREMGRKDARWVSAGEHDDMVMALALAAWGRTFRFLGMGWADLRMGILHWPG